MTLEQIAKIYHPDNYEGHLVEVLSGDAEVVHIGFPEYEVDELAFIEEYLNTYQAGGLYYPPKTYSKNGSFKGIAFDEYEELLSLIEKYND